MDVIKQISDGSEWFEAIEESMEFSAAEVDHAALAKSGGPRDAQQKTKK